ncbi:unnamed protein product [Timema podura]|uniref:G-protein coupled receptors family 1 profile domain-containing protein n=1 Tax=Timema podura TaxID=61482 RepID=A0ABN7NK13_TIMPD|nr:unnamed protein product [Timema podura]
MNACETCPCYITIISGCWALGSLVGFLPLLGWHKNFPDEKMQCFFTKVMTRLVPGVSVRVHYHLPCTAFGSLLRAHLPSRAKTGNNAQRYITLPRNLRQIVTMNPSPQGGAAPNSACTRHVGGAGTMLRVLGAAQKREVKATQNLSIIVLFFVICWVPLYTINFIQAFYKDCVIPQTITNLFIILSHLNSAGNPLLYAYHLRDFRAALKHLLYGIFGIQDESVNITNDFPTTRPPYGSQNALQQQAVHNNSINNSLQSLGDISLPNKRGSMTSGKYRHIYSDSPVMKDRFLLRGLSSTTLENRSMIASTVNGVYRAATLPMSTTIGRFDNTRDPQQPRKRIWTLTEVSSGVENDTYSVNRTEDLEPPCEPRVRRRSVRGRAGSQSDSIDSGRVNSAYIGDEAFEDFGFVDDDVFISDAILTAFRPRSADGLETRVHLTASENSHENVSPVVENTLTVRERLGSKNISKSVSSSNFNDVPVVEASDPRDMEEHTSRFVHTVEAEIYSSNVDDDRAELSPCRWNNLVIKSAVNKHCNGTNNLQKPRGGKIVRLNSAIDPGENKRTLPTSPTEVKLSPLKLVGEFLFSGKGVRTKDEANDASASTGSDTSLIACCEREKVT